MVNSLPFFNFTLTLFLQVQGRLPQISHSVGGFTSQTQGYSPHILGREFMLLHHLQRVTAQF
jgi:hypothetical protein